jgi:putative addiction module CopG family antidote
MTLHLPKDLENYVQAQVQSGRSSSSDEVITEAVRLFRQRQQSDESRDLQDIRQGLEEMKSGLGRPAEEVFADIEREFKLSTKA